jgi:formate C-acetyltransferase
MPNGGFRLVVSALKTMDYEPDPHMVDIFTNAARHTTTVSSTYTADVRCRSRTSTGLPDATAGTNWRLRRVTLYGVKRLIDTQGGGEARPRRAPVHRRRIRDREELAEQIRALKELQQMAAMRLRHLGPGIHCA